MDRINMELERVIRHYVRMTAERLSHSEDYVCNAHKYKISKDRVRTLVAELVAREPRAFVEGLTTERWHRMELTGEGTKKDPYEVQWRHDYFKTI